MGRRKWKLYQESMSRSYLQPLNNNIKRTSSSEDSDYHHARTNNWNPQTDSDQEKEAKPEINGKGDGGKAEKEEQKENEEKEERLKDWTPESKCYFCVDGKLDSEHTAHGVLVSFLLYSINIFYHRDDCVCISNEVVKIFKRC